MTPTESRKMVVDDYLDVLREQIRICEDHGGVLVSGEEAADLADVVEAAHTVIEQFETRSFDRKPEHYAEEIKLRDAIRKLVERFEATCV